MDEQEAKQKTRILGLSRNVLGMGLVSMLNDFSSDMIFPFIPIFLTSVLGASVAFVGLVEGIADATASILKIVSGSFSDRLERRKPFVVFGYSFSALAKPLLAAAAAPWHVLAVRFLDRVGKGTRDAPRDALISFSTRPEEAGRAFGFHRAADTLGAALGPLAAFLILPLIHNNLRTLFLLSFAASFCAVVALIVFVREVRPSHRLLRADDLTDVRKGMRPSALRNLGTPFIVFLISATILSLGRSSDAFLLLRAHSLGLALAFLPIVYFVSNISFTFFSIPAGILSDRIGHRNTFMIGILMFSGVYVLFAHGAFQGAIWILFSFYGVFNAFTEGVGRAIVADLVPKDMRATAYGVYNAATGIALLPASVVFGFLWERFGPATPFYYGAALGMVALAIFLVLRLRFRLRHAFE